MAATALCIAWLGGCEGCGDDEHKGTTSSARASASAVKVPSTRLTYDPGSPLHTMRVAEIFKKRLEPLGIASSAIKIGGDIVNIDVPNDKLAAAKQALDAARLDVYTIDDGHDPFSKNEEEHAAKFPLASEEVGEGKSAVFLYAPSEKRQALVDYVTLYAGSLLVLTGPFTHDSQTLVRAYFSSPENHARGEFLTSASADGAHIVLTFTGSAKSSIQWSSKQPTRFAARVDGHVIGVAAPDGEVKDGALRFMLADPTTDAVAIATALGGTAVSHLTVAVDKDRP